MIKNLLEKIAKASAEKVYATLGKSSGGMLLATSILGLTLSAGAQIFGICVNKKYTTPQKAFMIPQELGELLVSCLAIFAITKPTQKIASKLIKTGKIMSKDVAVYIKENHLAEKRGSLNFDFGKEVMGIIEKIEQSDRYINSGKIEQNAMIAPHKKALDSYEITADAASAIATTAASLATVGCAVPVIRNRFASYYQKRNLDLYNYYNGQNHYNRI